MRTRIEFVSTAFPPYPGEEAEVNPGRFGRRLAEALAEGLSGLGVAVGSLYSEDWGWVVPIEQPEFRLWIGCGNDETVEHGFLCFIEPSKPILRRWFKRIDTTSAVLRLGDQVERVLRENPSISGLRWRSGGA